EIGLNGYLENLGIEVVETDLGERMVQLTHTHPSHLIAPAIHLTKEDAAAVFGTEPTVEAIQRHARESLREKFIEATVGISGARRCSKTRSFATRSRASGAAPARTPALRSWRSAVISSGATSTTGPSASS